MAEFLKDKVILVSGEVTSLSMGIIHSFLKEMAIVIFPAKSLHQVEMMKSYKDISRHENFITLLIDLHDFDKLNETCETITEKFGKIDISVEIPEISNCKKELTEASIDEWNNMMETDMLPFFMGARVVLDLMKGNHKSMFVHITDSRFFENIKSCALMRIAFTTRVEMSKIFAEEAQRHGIRYYHFWANHLCNEKTPKPDISLEGIDPELISDKIINLYQTEIYNTEIAFQSFPKQLLQQQI